MSLEAAWPWLLLVCLGAFHGINPGMGWLFAVALGLQEHSRAAVWRALSPLALGHALSTGSVVLVVGLLQTLVPETVLHRLCAVVLLSFALYRLWRTRHPRWVGMQVNFWDLTVWSFLMASAHGAGLMLVPVLLQWPAADSAHTRLLQSMAPELLTSTPALLVAAVGVHTVSMLLVTGAIAVLVYEKLGLTLLRQTWFNLDLLWAIALLLAGVFALLF